MGFFVATNECWESQMRGREDFFSFEWIGTSDLEKKCFKWSFFHGYRFLNVLTIFTKVTNSSQVVTKLLQIILLLLEWRHRHVKNQWQTNFDLFRRTTSHDSSIWCVLDSHKLRNLRTGSRFSRSQSEAVLNFKFNFFVDKLVPWSTSSFEWLPDFPVPGPGIHAPEPVQESGPRRSRKFCNLRTAPHQ